MWINTLAIEHVPIAMVPSAEHNPYIGSTRAYLEKRYNFQIHKKNNYLTSLKVNGEEALHSSNALAIASLIKVSVLM